MEIEGPPVKAVELMRQIRDQINAEIEGKSFEEIRRMLDEKRRVPPPSKPTPTSSR